MLMSPCRRVRIREQSSQGNAAAQGSRDTERSTYFEKPTPLRIHSLLVPNVIRSLA
jgi:hypothetical protein